MKITKSKRILALVLSMLMIVTSIPIVAFNAFAATDSYIQAAEGAMQAFEGKVNQKGYIYANIDTAYNTYVELCTALDAYKYGGKTSLASTLTSKAQQLNDLVNDVNGQGLHAWTRPSFNGKGYHCGNEAKGTYRTGYHNIVFCSTANVENGGTNGTTFTNDWKNIGYANLKVAVPQLTVNVYVAGETSGYPAFMQTYSKKYFGTAQAFSLYYVAYNGSDNMKADTWYGYRNENSAGNLWQQWPDVGPNFPSNDNEQNVSISPVSTNTSSTALSAHNTVRLYNGEMLYNKAGNYDSCYDTFSSMSFTVKLNSRNKTETGTLGVEHTNTHYFINYQAVLDAQSTLNSTLVAKDLKKYREGGMRNVIEKLALSMSDDVNPAAQTYSNDKTAVASAVSTVAGQISTLYNNRNLQPTEDRSDYASIRTAVTTETRNKYLSNNISDGEQIYTTTSWNRFKAAYEAVQVLMTPVDTDGYVSLANIDPSLSDRLQELAAAEEGLTYLGFPEDTSELEALIMAFKALDDDRFANYSTVNALVNQVVINVWGSLDNFGVTPPTKASADDPDVVTPQGISDFNAAVVQLRLSKDFVVETDHGRMSLESAIEDYRVDNPLNYSNYYDVVGHREAGIAYRSSLATTPFVLANANAIFNEYDETVRDVINGFYSLVRSFSAIQNGTVFKNGTRSDITDLTASKKGDTRVGFGYTNAATMIVTEHGTHTLPFGRAYISFGTNIQSSNNSDFGNNKCTNNSLDSINIAATTGAVSDNIISTYTGTLKDVLVPDAMSDSDKTTTYKGSLSGAGTSGHTFSVSRIKYVDKDDNAQPKQVVSYLDGGTQRIITSALSATDFNLDTVLGVTDGSSANSIVNGSLFSYSTDKNMAKVYAEGDFNVTVTASPVATLSREGTLPTSQLATYSAYFGAVGNHTYRDTTYCAARTWFTSQSNDEKIGINVYIVDLSYYMDLIKECDALAQTGLSKYTQTSMEAFSAALQAAKTYQNYQNDEYYTIVETCKQKYKDLWDARENLKIDVNFTYMTSSGDWATQNFQVKYNESITAQWEQVTALVSQDIVANGLVYHFTNWDPQGNWALPAKDAVRTSFTAQYETYSALDWTDYNAAQQALKTALASGSYYAAGLNTVKAQVEALSYFTYTDAQKLSAQGITSAQLASEASTIQSITASLPDYRVDASTFEAMSATVDTLNADAYDVAAVQAVKNAQVTTATVTIAGTAYTGYDYDTAIAAILTAMADNAYEYTVVVYDVDMEVPYFLTKSGAYVEGTLDSNEEPVAPQDADCYFRYGDLVVASNPISASDACSFEVEIIAHNTDTTTESRYVCTATEYQFNVRGNTTIYTSAGETTDYKICFVDGRNNNFVYVTYSSTASIAARIWKSIIASIPTIPFYTIDSLSNRSTGATVTKTGSVTLTSKVTYITINYGTSEQTDGYTVTVVDAGGNQLSQQTGLKYNDLVTVEANGAAGFVDTATGTLIAYGSSYTFNACQSITLQATGTTDGKVHVSVVRPVYSNGKVFFIGSFALPDGMTYTGNVKGMGIVIDVLGDNDELTLKDVSSSKYVYNFAASSKTVGYQFTVFTAEPPAGRTFNYRAYTIYSLNGVEYVEYSDVITTTF